MERVENEKRRSNWPVWIDVDKKVGCMDKDSKQPVAFSSIQWECNVLVVQGCLPEVGLGWIDVLAVRRGAAVPRGRRQHAELSVAISSSFHVGIGNLMAVEVHKTSNKPHPLAEAHNISPLDSDERTPTVDRGGRHNVPVKKTDSKLLMSFWLELLRCLCPVRSRRFGGARRDLGWRPLNSFPHFAVGVVLVIFYNVGKR